MNARQGLTLVEVMVALLILLVGILGVIGFQTFAVSASTEARIVTELTRVARGELASQRQVEGTTASEACRVSPTLGSGYTCTVSRTDCVMRFDASSPNQAGGSNDQYWLECGLTVTERTGRFVTVVVDGPRGQSVELSTLYTGVFIGTGGEVVE